MVIYIKYIFGKFTNIQTKQISFFSSKAPPYYEVQQIIGFVEELVDFKLEKTMQEDLIAL